MRRPTCSRCLHQENHCEYAQTRKRTRRRRDKDDSASAMTQLATRLEPARTNFLDGSLPSDMLATSRESCTSVPNDSFSNFGYAAFAFELQDSTGGMLNQFSLLNSDPTLVGPCLLNFNSPSEVPNLISQPPAPTSSVSQHDDALLTISLPTELADHL